MRKEGAMLGKYFYLPGFALYLEETSILLIIYNDHIWSNWVNKPGQITDIRCMLPIAFSII